MSQSPKQDAEVQRLDEDARREKHWKRWGPYLSERQWGTVREDYSAHGTCWDDFPHDHDNYINHATAAAIIPGPLFPHLHPSLLTLCHNSSHCRLCCRRCLC